MTAPDRLPRFQGIGALVGAAGAMIVLCVGVSLLCCFLPRIVEWR